MTTVHRLTLLLLLVLTSAPCSAGEPIVLGYYPGYEKFPVEKIPYERFTHIAHAFVSSDPEGVLKPNKLAPNKRLTELAAEHGVQVILSIGGWGDADGFEMATSTPEKMAQWVDDAIAMMHDNGYVGLDVDWEFPKDESTRDRFTKLVLALRAKMDTLSEETGKKYLITSAVTARPKEGQWIDGPAMESAIDFLNVMTYDFAGPWSEVALHHSALMSDSRDPQGDWRCTDSAMRYWNEVQKIPKEKLIVGVPLYGRRLPAKKPFDSLEGAPKKGFSAPFYRDFIGLVDKGWTHATSPDGSAWLVPPEGEVGVISYDSPESAHKTGVWSRESGYRGIFFWGIGQDAVAEGEFPVMNAAIDGYRATE